MAKPIEHIGVVSAVGDNMVVVEIVAESACATCHARGACGMSETGSKRIEVRTPHAADFAIGERCMVSIGRNAGMKAVVLSYVLPLVLLIVVLTVCVSAGMHEGVAAAASLGAVAVYYLLLHLFGRRLETDIIFQIKKL